MFLQTLVIYFNTIHNNFTNFLLKLFFIIVHFGDLNTLVLQQYTKHAVAMQNMLAKNHFFKAFITFDTQQGYI